MISSLRITVHSDDIVLVQKDNGPVVDYEEAGIPTEFEFNGSRIKVAWTGDGWEFLIEKVQKP